MGEPVIGTCKLCGSVEVELRDSHIVPRWAYKRSRGGEGANQNPVVIRGETAMQISDQISEHLLCAGCEQRFGSVENTASKLAYQRDGSAPFLDSVGPVIAEADRTRFAEPGRLPIGDLVYFGASVLWRGAIAKGVPNCRLGETYEAEFRAFLNGDTEFPRHAWCVLAFHDLPMGTGEHLASICTVPHSFREGRVFVHRFVIFGLFYYFVVGQVEPSWMKDLCVNRPPHLVMLAPQEMLIEWVGPWMARARAFGSLARQPGSIRRVK